MQILLVFANLLLPFFRLLLQLLYPALPIINLLLFLPHCLFVRHHSLLLGTHLLSLCIEDRQQFFILVLQLIGLLAYAFELLSSLNPFPLLFLVILFKPLALVLEESSSATMLLFVIELPLHIVPVSLVKLVLLHLHFPETLLQAASLFLLPLVLFDGTLLHFLDLPGLLVYPLVQPSYCGLPLLELFIEMLANLDQLVFTGLLQFLSKSCCFPDAFLAAESCFLCEVKFRLFKQLFKVIGFFMQLSPRFFELELLLAQFFLQTSNLFLQLKLLPLALQ